MLDKSIKKRTGALSLFVIMDFQIRDLPTKRISVTGEDAAIGGAITETQATPIPDDAR